ncbi:MAG TPA: transglycosylase domain-containing protein [Candidatus Paceibacterota bacterium]
MNQTPIHKKVLVRKKKPNPFLKFLESLVIAGVSGVFILAGVLFLWISLLQVPPLEGFHERIVSNSTKIYDRTGKVVLYDIYENAQRTLVPLKDISPLILKAVVSTEDKSFYQHHGIDIKSTTRAITYTALNKLGINKKLEVQGGSTITQQVLKNTVLTSDKTLTRKLKEWFLAVRLEQKLSKDEIIEHYLNEIPFGGSLYGIEEASQTFFGKKSSEVTTAEAAYLAAIINLPTYYSPYGNNRVKLDARKNFVLSNMLNEGYITKDEYNKAKAEVITFQPLSETQSKAIHFVLSVREYLENKYGKDMVENQGLKVTTTLDWELQEKAEEIVKKNAEANEAAWNAKNQALIAIQPKTGQILAMVGSRDYNNDEVDGKFNITTSALRQPGSSFKPFIYAASFEKGYTDKSILFDVPTQFTQSCDVNQFTQKDGCYSPNNYDGKYRGAMSVRNALAQSINVPAVKMLYLVGVPESLTMAKRLGITTLKDANQYGLTLVLGGGEVTLLQMTSAYGVFANDGVRNAPTQILKVETFDGKVLESYTPKEEKVLAPQVARMITDILADNVARTPLFGSNSFLYFGSGVNVAGKTGTTNNNKDAWLIGYTPEIAIGVWSGNNNNTAMKKGSAISGPTFKEVMNEAIKLYGVTNFMPPEQIITGKPILDGLWQGDTVDSRQIGTDANGNPIKETVVQPNLHSELYWINRTDPTGPRPANPSAASSLFAHFEAGIIKYFGYSGEQGDAVVLGGSGAPKKNGKAYLLLETENKISRSKPTTISFEKAEPETEIEYVEFTVGSKVIGRITNGSYRITVDPADVQNLGETSTLTVTTKLKNGELSNFEYKVTIVN